MRTKVPSLAAALCLATIVMNVLPWAGIRSGDWINNPSVSWEFTHSVWPAQVSLVAFWAGISHKLPIWRACYTLGFIGLTGRLLTHDFTDENWAGLKWFFLADFVAQAFAIALILSLARACGMQLATGKRPAALGDDMKYQKLQFTLRDMLWTMVGLAFFLAILQRIAAVDEWLHWLRHWQNNATSLLLAEVFLGLAAIHLALGTLAVPWRVTILVAAVLIKSMVTFPDDLEPRSHWQFTINTQYLRFATIEGLWIAGSLGALRLAGYRLVYRCRWRDLVPHHE